MRVLRCLTVIALASVLLLLSGVGPADAHTELVESSPAGGDRLREPPETIELTFNEDVRPELATVTVAIGGRLAERLRVERGRTGSMLIAILPADLPANGRGDVAWTVAYRVSSDDGHPVEGTLAFRAPVNKSTKPTPGSSATDDPTSDAPSGSDATGSGTSTSPRIGDRSTDAGSGTAATVVIGLIVALGVSVGCAVLVRARRRDDA